MTLFDFFFDRVGDGVIRGIAFLVQRLPLETALGWGRGMAAGVYCFNKRRRVAYVNLKAAFPESTVQERKQWIREMFQHLGMSAIEMMRFPILRKEEVGRLVSTNPHYETYLSHRRSGKGSILLTAHLGNWEFAQIQEGLRGRPITVLVRRQKHPRLDQLLNSFRQYYGSVSVGTGKTGIRDLIKTLREGGCVGMAADQSGGDDGVWVRFFGRLTTSPRGPIALALKLGVKVLPVFMVRQNGPFHQLIFEPPLELVQTGDPEKDLQVNAQKYIQLLESYITKYKSQWLWGHKRWKRTRTKRILILSDGKAGHVKQSEALVKEIKEKGEKKEPPYEFLIEKIEVEFRGSWRKRIFPLFAFFFIPWAEGRLAWLQWFLSAESARKLERANPDVVVSAGSSLVPINLCVAKENLAKSTVLMRPSFPFNLFKYDLAVIPAHDRGLLPSGKFRIQGALSGLDPENLEVSKKLLAGSLQDPERIRISLFLGGETRRYKFSLSEVEDLLEEVERASEKLGGDFLVTTSRRTPEAVSQFLRKRLENHPRCQLCVIASEDSRPEVVPGMMALADFLIVTEDSLSMISEAVSSGKRVVVVKMSQNGLPEKHYRFQEILQKEWGVPVVETHQIFEVLGNGEVPRPYEHFDEERNKLREKLEALL